MNILDKMRKEEKKRRKEHDDYVDRRMRESEQLEAEWDRISVHLRRATASDYNAWLTGFVKRGGKPTHCYDYNLPSHFWIAGADFYLPRMCGSLAVCVIVKPGVKVTYDGIGHNNIFYMDDFRHVGFYVPIFSNSELYEEG